MRNLTQTETLSVSGGHIVEIFNNCVSNGMNLAGVSYAIGAHRHGQMNQIAEPYDGKNIVIFTFLTGCILSLVNDIYSHYEGKEVVHCICMNGTKV